MRNAMRLAGPAAWLLLVGLAAPAAAQMPESPDAAVREFYLRDLSVLERKFTALAEAFPASRFDWRPSPGVRSVRDVIALIAAENAALVPPAFGRAPMDGPDWEYQRTETAYQALERQALLATLRRSFAHVRDVITSIPDGELTRQRTFFGQQWSTARVLFGMVTDQHEHLGQLIAYARSNDVVPPWSRGTR